MIFIARNFELLGFAEGLGESKRLVEGVFFFDFGELFAGRFKEIDVGYYGKKCVVEMGFVNVVVLLYIIYFSCAI